MNSKLPDCILVKNKEAFWIESVSTAPRVRKKLPSILSQGQASTKTLDNDGDHALQESVTLKSM